MRIIFLALFLAASAFAQFNSSPGSGTIIVNRNPNGIACNTNSAKGRLFQGALYTCQNGVYTPR